MLQPPKSLSTWTIHQEVFQNEPAFATMKRAAAFAAGKLLVRTESHSFRRAPACTARRSSGNRTALLR
jgi:hypothetical protein